MKITEHKKYSIDDLQEDDLFFLLDVINKLELSEDSPISAHQSLERWKAFCAHHKVQKDDSDNDEPKD